MEPFEIRMRRGGSQAIREASRFFMRDDPVHKALRRISGKLCELAIPHAIVGGMALVAHGYDRTTVDVDILVTADGLAEIHRLLNGRGYVPPFEGSRNLRDTEDGVRIEFLVAGQFPGDGKPKPTPFPDPAGHSVEIDGVKYLTLPKLVELKLASGMSNSGRLKDLADVQELIRALDLPASFADGLHPSVRDRFLELLRGVESDRG